MNVAYVYPSAQLGEFRLALLCAAGPTSYSSLLGDPVSNPGSNEYLSFPNNCTTLSGNFSVKFIPLSVGLGQIRAGAPAPSQSGWTAIWLYSGKQGVTVVQNVGGTGMTPGTVAPIVFAGGVGGGAAGTVTVLTATTVAINITNTGSYTTPPTATVSGTGGTPPTLTVATSPAAGVVTAGTNLSTELIQFGAMVSQL